MTSWLYEFRIHFENNRILFCFQPLLGFLCTSKMCHLSRVQILKTSLTWIIQIPTSHLEAENPFGLVFKWIKFELTDKFYINNLLEMPTFSLLQKEKAIKPIFFFKASTDRKLHKYRGFVHVMQARRAIQKKPLVHTISQFLIINSLVFCLLIMLMYSLKLKVR